MKQLTAIVQATAGLHARPASLLVKKAGEFTSIITLEKDGKKADAKRLLSVLTLAAKQGDTITISADGSDEDAALEAVKQLVESNC